MPVLERTSMTPYYHKALHYLYYGSYKGGKLNQPHFNSNGVKVRNHLLTGVNCRTDSYKHTCQDWSRALKLNKRTKNKSINLVISFKKSEVNLEDPATCKSLALLARKFVKSAFGKDAIAIIALQDDNTNKTPHLHIDVANINLANHDRAINGKQRDIFRLRSINDSIIRKYNSQRLLQQEPKLSIVKSNVAKPKDKYLTKIANCIYRVASNVHVTSKSKFRKILKNKYHIKAHFIRPRKRKNGRKRRHKHYGVTFQYRGSPKIKGSKLNEIVPGIRYQSLVHQFRINKDKINAQHRRREHYIKSYKHGLSKYYSTIKRAIKNERGMMAANTLGSANDSVADLSTNMESALGSSVASSVSTAMKRSNEAVRHASEQSEQLSEAQSNYIKANSKAQQVLELSAVATPSERQSAMDQLRYRPDQRSSVSAYRASQSTSRAIHSMASTMKPGVASSILSSASSQASLNSSYDDFDSSVGMGLLAKFNQPIDSSQVSAAELVYHPISLSDKSSANSSSKIPSPSKTSSEVMNNINKIQQKEMIQNDERAKEKRAKHKKIVKASAFINRQSKQYHRQARIEQQEAAESSKLLANDHHVFSWLTHKIKSSVHRIISSALSKIQEVIQSHKQKKFIKNRRKQIQKSDDGLQL